MADEPQKVDLEGAGPARGKPEPKAPITDPPKEPPKPSEADKITPPPAEKKTGIGDITQNPKTAKESPLPAVDTGSKNKEPPKSKAPRGDKPQEPPKDIAGKGGNPKDKVVKFPDGGKENPKGKKDKVSQGSKGGSVEPPIVEPQEPTAPPRPLVEEKIVYLKLKELHPFHTYRKHPFQVRDNFKMRETAASIKERGVITPGIVRPEKDGKGYEIIAGHRRHRGSELAGFEDMPCIIRYNIRMETRLSFPTTKEEVQAALKRIGVDGVRYQEVILTEHDSNLSGFCHCITQYDRIDEVNYLVHLLSGLSPDELATFLAVLDYGEHNQGVHDLINLALNLEHYEFHPDVSSDEELGHIYADDMAALDIPEKLLP